MAKKIKKVMARLSALEKTVTRLLTGGSRRPKKARKAKKTKRVTVKKAKLAKSAKKSKRKAVFKKRRAAAPVAKKALPKTAHHKKTKRKAIRRIPLPTIEQLAPSGAPEFVQPLDQV